jgi:uncharacterized protein
MRASFAAVVSFLALFIFSFCETAQSASLGTDIADAAKRQIGVTLTYDPAYKSISFPGGDVKSDTGVCTDVVIRALRISKKLDLQVEINTDIKNNPSAYPKKWGAVTPNIDPNIDHRRVPNQMKYFERRGFALPITSDLSKYLIGDIVAWSLGGGQTHIGILSAKVGPSGRRLAIHNIGRGTLEEDILLSYPIIGHYRLPVKVAPIGSAGR